MKRRIESKSVSSPTKAKAMRPSVVTPRSLSVSTILQLGRTVKSNTTVVNLFSFQIETITWSSIPVPVVFNISQDVLGEGGFRMAYKADTSTKGFCDKTWVIKRYKPEALEVIQKINQSVEGQIMKG